MIVNIILLLVWIAACLAEGIRDGFFYHNRVSATNPDKHNIHWLFTIERFIIWSLITWIYSLSNSSFATSIFSESLIFIFSFMHNGAYYYIRHKIDGNVYPKGWFDSSTTSESFLEFNLISRIFMAVTGMFGIVASFTM